MSLRINSIAYRKDVIQEEKNDYQKYRDLLWTAPELLCLGDERPFSGTQKGDIYSYSIIMQEILFRDSPFFAEKISPKG